MIFLIAAAALCMGGIVAYLAREKGRSPITWAIYGTLVAPIALPHILIVNPRDDEDDDVWAEIRNAIQTQSVNDQRPIMGKAGKRPMTDPQAPVNRNRNEAPPATAMRREAPLRQTPAPSVAREASPANLEREDPNPAPRPDITAEPVPEPTLAELRPEPRQDPRPEPRYESRSEPGYESRPEPRPEPRYEPKHDMFADKRNQTTPAQRAEPSFSPATSTGGARAAANDFTLNASDRIGAPHAAYTPASGGDMRSRAPLSIDPNADRGESRPIAGRLFAFGAVAVAVAAGFFVLGPTLARLVPPELAFWAQPDVKDVKNTAPAGITPPGTTADVPSGGAPGVASNEALPGGNTSGDEAREVGAARFGGPIKSDTKAPAYKGSSATPTDLAAATRGMKPVDVPPEETKSPAPKAEPKSETKSAAVAPPPPEPKPEAPKKAEAPKAETPKTETKAAAVTPAPKAEAPKRVEPPKTEAPKAAAKAVPKAAPKAAPQEDFLSMVNKAIATGTTPQPATARSESEQIEQVSAANDLVQSVQVKLRERGYDPGSIDGRTNPKTVQAIRDYQQSIGMTPDGLIDVALMERLGVVGKRLQFPSGR
jgi:hypothetical protein